MMTSINKPKQFGPRIFKLYLEAKEIISFSIYHPYLAFFKTRTNNNYIFIPSVAHFKISSKTKSAGIAIITSKSFLCSFGIFDKSL